MPSKAQIRTITGAVYISSFSPVYGGYYASGSHTNGELGNWWGSEAADAIKRTLLQYVQTTNNMGNQGYNRYNSVYIRCVVKKNTKTLSNLTYMQDMTPQFRGFK